MSPTDLTKNLQASGCTAPSSRPRHLVRSPAPVRPRLHIAVVQNGPFSVPGLALFTLYKSEIVDLLSVDYAVHCPDDRNQLPDSSRDRVHAALARGSRGWMSTWCLPSVRWPLRRRTSYRPMISRWTSGRFIRVYKNAKKIGIFCCHESHILPVEL